jgi:5-methyltetrahydrofolate--homocysteine methyltransferase
LSGKILEELKDAVIVGNVKKAKKLAEQIVNQGTPTNTAIDVLMKAMKTVDERYVRKEYFVIDVASSASAMREAFKVFEPYLEVESSIVKGKIVIGSLKGNIQGLGKDIVAATLQSASFQVVNLGVDVAPEDFVKAAVREKAQIIGVSVSMEETIPYLKDIVDILEREGLRGKIKVIIGGNAVSEKTRKEYGLDAYAVDAQEALKKVEALLG